MTHKLALPGRIGDEALFGPALCVADCVEPPEPEECGLRLSGSAARLCIPLKAHRCAIASKVAGQGLNSKLIRGRNHV